MSTPDQDADWQSAISAIARGDLTQVYRIADAIKALDEKVEGLAAVCAQPAAPASQADASTRTTASGVPDVNVVDTNAKTADIRDGLQDLAERFNLLLQSLREAGIIEDSNG